MTNEKEFLIQLQSPESRERAFRELMSLYKERLYWHIRKIVISHDDADDVLQNTFIKVYRSIHNFKGDSVYVEEFKDRKARTANRGGWFSFDMRVMKGQPMALVAEYWGGFTGSKTFDILVDGQRIATENISSKADGKFIDVQYDIPEEYTANASVIHVKFQPHVGHRAGPLFGIRTIKR